MLHKLLSTLSHQGACRFRLRYSQNFASLGGSRLEQQINLMWCCSICISMHECKNVMEWNGMEWNGIGLGLGGKQSVE